MTITDYATNNIFNIIELVDSMSRDGPDTLVYVIHYKMTDNSV